MAEEMRIAQALLECKAELTELKLEFLKLVERVQELESREMGGGVYLEGVADSFRAVIEENRNRKR